MAMLSVNDNLIFEVLILEDSHELQPRHSTHQVTSAVEARAPDP